MIMTKCLHSCLAGYPNHAAFVLEEKMAKKPEAVKKFLYSLREKLQLLWIKEKEKMLAFKASESKKLGFKFNKKIGEEDFW